MPTSSSSRSSREEKGRNSRNNFIRLFMALEPPTKADALFRCKLPVWCNLYNWSTLWLHCKGCAAAASAAGEPEEEQELLSMEEDILCACLEPQLRPTSSSPVLLLDHWSSSFHFIACVCVTICIPWILTQTTNLKSDEAAAVVDIFSS